MTKLTVCVLGSESTLTPGTRAIESFSSAGETFHYIQIARDQQHHAIGGGGNDLHDYFVDRRCAPPIVLVGPQNDLDASGPALHEVSTRTRGVLAQPSLGPFLFGLALGPHELGI